MPSLKGSKNHLIEGAKIEASSHKEATPNSQLNNQCEILEQLLPSFSHRTTEATTAATTDLQFCRTFKRIKLKILIWRADN